MLWVLHLTCLDDMPCSVSCDHDCQIIGYPHSGCIVSVDNHCKLIGIEWFCMVRESGLGGRTAPESLQHPIIVILVEVIGTRVVAKYLLHLLV